MQHCFPFCFVGSILFVFIYSVFSYLWGHTELKGCEGRGTKKGDGRFLVGGEDGFTSLPLFCLLILCMCTGALGESVSLQHCVQAVFVD